MGLYEKIIKNIDDKLYSSSNNLLFRSDLASLAEREYCISGELFEYLYNKALEDSLANTEIKTHLDVLNRFRELLEISSQVIYYYEGGYYE